MIIGDLRYWRPLDDWRWSPLLKTFGWLEVISVIEDLWMVIGDLRYWRSLDNWRWSPLLKIVGWLEVISVIRDLWMIGGDLRYSRCLDGYDIFRLRDDWRWSLNWTSLHLTLLFHTFWSMLILEINIDIDVKLYKWKRMWRWVCLISFLIRNRIDRGGITLILRYMWVNEKI